jgi:hypothetical protein
VKDNNSFLYKIEIHSMYLNSIWLNLQFQFNGWINIQLNWIQIQLKTVGVQIGGKCIQYFLMNMSLEKTFNTQIWNDSFPCIFTWEWVNNVWQYEEPKVVLPKPFPMNHHHQNYILDI